MVSVDPSGVEGPLPGRDAETAANVAKAVIGVRPAARTADKDSPADRIAAARTARSAGNAEVRHPRAPGTTPGRAPGPSDPAATARRETGETGPTVNGAASVRIEARTTTAGTIGAPVTGVTIGPGMIGAPARPGPATDPNSGTATPRAAAAAKAASARAGVGKAFPLDVANLDRTSRIFPKTSRRRSSIRPSAGIC